MGHLSHHRGRTCAGAAAHAGRNKNHLRSLEHIGDFILALLGGTLAHLGVCARAAALGQFRAQLYLDRRVVLGQGLLIGIQGDELDPLQPIGHHPVHRVAAAAAHAYHLDRGNVFVQFFVKHQSHSLVPPSGNMVTVPPNPGPVSGCTDNTLVSYTSLSYHLLALIASCFFLFKALFYNLCCGDRISYSIRAPSPPSISPKPA